MMRDLVLITLISSVLGTVFPVQDKAANILREEMFSIPNQYRKLPVLGWDRRRLQGGISARCRTDMRIYQIWCTKHANVSCDLPIYGADHTKWEIQFDHDTEWRCFPSSCSASDVRTYYLNQLKKQDSSARYCSLECPYIRFDVSGTSEDGQSISISGMYKYANLSYECAGAAAITTISECEEVRACPVNATGLTNCTVTTKPRRWSPYLASWKIVKKVCLANECTDKENLKKMNDFEYATLAYLMESRGGGSFAKSIRDLYFVEFSCPGGTSSHKYSKYVLIFGITSAVLFVVCFVAICLLRLRRGRVVMTPIVSIEFHKSGEQPLS